METEEMKIGVMGGTFDPVHFGHLVLAETVREQFDLDRVLFVPAGDPPHKQNKKITPASLRLGMVQQAVEGNPHFQVSALELDRPGRSYTVDTMKTLREKVTGPVQFYFITGADAIMEILSWKDVDLLCELCAFIAATRPGTDGDKLASFLAELPSALRNNIHLTTMPALEISSTEIREKVRQGKSIRYLVPEQVEKTIRKEGLYV